MYLFYNQNDTPMKHIAIADAVGLISATAQAQGSVTITGLADACVGSVRMADGSSRVQAVHSGGMTTSYFGLVGTEDLGAGLKTHVALTSFLRMDNGSAGRFDGDPFFARDANVGLSGDFGSVRLGRSAAPNFIPSTVVNPFGNSFTFSPLILHANVNTAQYRYRTTPSDTGWSNQIVYGTPQWKGLQLNVQYQFGEQPGSTISKNKHNFGANLTYKAGPLTFTGYYERDQISNPVNPSILAAAIAGEQVPMTRKVWMVGAAYDAGDAKGFASYGRSTAEITRYAANTTSLGISAPLGIKKQGLFLAAIARTEVSGPFNGQRVTASVGYDYFLAKRTDLYAIAMRDRMTSFRSENSFGFGIRHRF